MPHSQQKPPERVNATGSSHSGASGASGVSSNSSSPSREVKPLGEDVIRLGAQLLRRIVSGEERTPTVAQLKASSPERDEVLEREGLYILKKLGSGSFGTVNAAYWTKWKKLVAVKMMSIRKLSEDAVKKFLPRELQTIQVYTLL